MMGFMNDALGDHGASKIREEDGMSTATSRPAPRTSTTTTAMGLEPTWV
jgi:hypothetical protein